MKERVLKVHRQVPELVLKTVERTSAFFPNQQGRDCWYGFEWIRTPGNLGIPSLYTTEEFLGDAKTTPSYLHRYNKNDFIHECYYGEVRLQGKVKTHTLQVGDDLQAARDIYGFGGLRIFYPRVASTKEPFKLYKGTPGIGVPSVWKHPYKTMYVFVMVRPNDDGSVNYFINFSRKQSTADKKYKEMTSPDFILGYYSSVQRITDEIITSSDIPEFTPPSLYGHEYFDLYKFTGLNGALSDAASHADGFHFSRLAGEIAMDGLVISTISSLSQRASKSIRKAGPLGSKLAACFKLLPSAYLAYQFGIAAPLREYASLPGAIQNQFTEIGPLVGQYNTSYRDFSVSSRVSLNIGSPSSARQAANLAYLTRGGLSLDDIWELVPLSFVVDWFLNISKFLEAGRASQIYSELPVKSATFSTSFERDVPLPDGVEGSIRHRCYIRHYLQGSSLPAEAFSFSLSDFRGTLSLRNIDEGLALFLSYII